MLVAEPIWTKFELTFTTVLRALITRKGPAIPAKVAMIPQWISLVVSVLATTNTVAAAPTLPSKMRSAQSKAATPGANSLSPILRFHQHDRNAPKAPNGMTIMSAREFGWRLLHF